MMPRNIPPSFPLLILMGAVSSPLLGCDAPPPEQAAVRRGIKHATAVAAQSRFERALAGTVRPVDSAPLSFGVGGTLQVLNVDVGDKVKEGDVLAKLDDRPFNLNVRAAKASAEKARASAKEARTSLDSFTEMYNSRAVSERQYDQQVAREASARSDLQLARAQVDLSQRDQEQAVLVAPFAGIITERNVDNFEEVAPSQQIVMLQGETGLEVALQVPESVVSQIQVGRTATVEFSSVLPTRLNAEVNTVAASAGSTGTFEVTVLLEAAPAEVRAGMNATVFLDLSVGDGAAEGVDSSAVEIPFRAVFAVEDSPDTHAVWVYDAAAEIVQLRTVTTGEIRGEMIVVTSGLTAGEVVASAGTSFLSNGMSVTLWEG